MWKLTGRIVLRFGPKICSVLPFTMYQQGAADDPYPDAVKLPDPNETGFDRLKKIFQADKYGKMSDEAVLSLQSMYAGVFIGVLYGGILNARDAYQNFMRNNEATIFRNHFEAKKLLQDRVTIAFGYGGLKWGWRIGLFTGILIFVSSCVEAYRGKNSVVDYTAGGFAAGCLYKLSDGLIPTFVGGVLGAILGSIGGVLVMAILKLSGISMADIKVSFMKLASSRDKLKEEIYEKQSMIKEKVLTGAHEQTVGTNKDLKLMNEPIPPSSTTTDSNSLTTPAVG